jgi:hypothetical protein
MTIVTRLLTRRFGQIPLSLTENLEKLSTKQLEELADKQLEFNQLSQVISWLETQV